MKLADIITQKDLNEIEEMLEEGYDITTVARIYELPYDTIYEVFEILSKESYSPFETVNS